ncbi:MAG: C40 family peptidase [Gemmatimonadaceae bacterium]
MARQLRSILRLVALTLAVHGVVSLDRGAHTPSVALAAPASPASERMQAPTPAVDAPRTVSGRPARIDVRVDQPFDGFDLPEIFRDSIVRLATAQVGKRYRHGGTTPRGFDCSGLVRYVLSKVHMPLPRSAYLQARVGAPIGRDQLQPGDIVAFGQPDSVSHIGIYVGDGMFVHASSVAGRVIVSSLDRKPHRLIQPLHGARRLLAFAGTTSRGG